MKSLGRFTVLQKLQKRNQKKSMTKYFAKIQKTLDKSRKICYYINKELEFIEVPTKTSQIDQYKIF